MDRELGKNIEAGARRIDFLESNCDKVEEKGYMKRFSHEQLAQMKENLSETCIQINDVEEEKKEVVKDFKARLEPLTDERKRLLKWLKDKVEYVTENCYKFVDMETREVGFYNQDGDLIESRPAYQDELQTNIFQLGRKTGTNN
jgi:DNA-binding transcriptional regulator GbsR (MarR family)